MNVPPNKPPKPHFSGKPEGQLELPSKPGMINPVPLARSLVLLPNTKLKEFRERVELLRGYLLTIAQTKTIKSNQKRLVDQQLERLQRVLAEFEHLNNYSDKTNLKHIVNSRLNQLQQLEQEYNDLQAQSFQILRKYQVKYKDTGVLARKLQQGIEDLEKVSNGLYTSASEGTVAGTDLEDFVEQYRSSRTRYHKLCEVRKRLAEDRIAGVI